MIRANGFVAVVFEHVGMDRNRQSLQFGCAKLQLWFILIFYLLIVYSASFNLVLCCHSLSFVVFQIVWLFNRL